MKLGVLGLNTEYMIRADELAIAAEELGRRQRYPDEVPYVYKGTYIGGGVWNEQARAEISQRGDEYWQRDITL